MAMNEQASSPPIPTQPEQADLALADALIARMQWVQRALSPWTRRWLPAASGPDRVAKSNPDRVALTTSQTTSFLGRIQRAVEVAGFWRIDAEALNPIRYDRFGGAIVERFPDTSHRYEAQPAAANADASDLVLAGTGESTAEIMAESTPTPAQPGNFQAFGSFADFKAALESGWREEGGAPASPPSQPATPAQQQASPPLQRTVLPQSPLTPPPQSQQPSQAAQPPLNWPRRPRPRARIEELTPPAVETDLETELPQEPAMPAYQAESLPAMPDQGDADLSQAAETIPLQRRPEADVAPPVKPSQPTQPAAQPSQAARPAPATETSRRPVQRAGAESELAPLEPEQQTSLESQAHPSQAGQAETRNLPQAEMPELTLPKLPVEAQPLTPARKPADLPVQRSIEQGAAPPPVERSRPSLPSSQAGAPKPSTPAPSRPATEPASQRSVAPEVSLPESEQPQPLLRPAEVAEPPRRPAPPDPGVEPRAQRSTVEELPLRELPAIEPEQATPPGDRESPPEPGQRLESPVQRSTLEELPLRELPPTEPEQATPPERGQAVEPAVQRQAGPELPLTEKPLVEKQAEIPEIGPDMLKQSPALPSSEGGQTIESPAQRSTAEEMPLRELPSSEKTQPILPAEQADKPEPRRASEPPVQRAEESGGASPDQRDRSKQATPLPPSKPVEPASRRSVESELLLPDLPLVESEQAERPVEVSAQPGDSVPTQPGPVVEPPVQRSTAQEMPLRELPSTEPAEVPLPVSRVEPLKEASPEPGQRVEPPAQQSSEAQMALRELLSTEPEEVSPPVSRVERLEESPRQPGPVVEPPVQRSSEAEIPLRELSPTQKTQPSLPVRQADAPESSQSFEPPLQRSAEPEETFVERELPSQPSGPVDKPERPASPLMPEPGPAVSSLQRSMPAEMPLRELSPVERDQPSPPVEQVAAPERSVSPLALTREPELPPLNEPPASRVAAPELSELPPPAVRQPEPVVQRMPQVEVELPLRSQPLVQRRPDEAAPTRKIEEASGLDTAILARATSSARLPLFDAGRELGRVIQGNPVQTRLLPQMAALPQARVQARPAEADEARRWPDEPAQPVTPPFRPAVGTATRAPLPLALPARLEVKTVPPVDRLPPTPSASAANQVQRQAVAEEKPAASIDTAPALLPAGSIQRVETEGTGQPKAAEPSPAVELDKLARQIYPLIKRMLAVERERRPIR